MKIPCEVVVWYVLPTLRREVAKELVMTHNVPQSVVAKKFGVTDAAISQYLKKKRGENKVIESSPQYSSFMNEIKTSAGRIANNESDFPTEMCRICTIVKSNGMMEMIYMQKLGCKPPMFSCEQVITL